MDACCRSGRRALAFFESRAAGAGRRWSVDRARRAACGSSQHHPRGSESGSSAAIRRRSIEPRTNQASQLIRRSYRPSAVTPNYMKSQTKTSVVTFRLTDEEYTLLKSACGAQQTSISAVARRKLLDWAEALAMKPRVDERLGEITARLDALVQLLGRERQ